MFAAKVTIERRAIKNTRLRVCEDGSVLLIVPDHFTDTQVNGILLRKSDWINDKRSFFAKRSPIRHKLSPNELRLFGDTYRFVHEPSLRFETDLDYRRHLLRVGIDLVDADLRKRWYRRFARSYLNQRVSELSRSNGFKFNRLYVRAPGKRWGSCSAKRNISLNWRLVEAPKSVIDYVILHELLHTRLMSHDQHFWSHLRAICPHAAASREWLERNRPI